jgi:NTP pyrophosphatase (non-canonical NTP hydrolase)
MLIVSELAEGLEEERKQQPYVYVKDNKPEGLGVELADAVIRIADLCGYLGVDLEEVIKAKINYNSKRPYKHGKKF